MPDATHLAIGEFAAHLVPEAFTTASTAHRVELLPLASDGPAFGEWIERCQQDAVAARYPSGHSPAGMVYVRRGDERWRWDQEPCCELAWLLDRVNGELADFPDPWAFVCSLEVRDRAHRALGEAFDPEEVSWRLPWYAEARGRGVAQIRTGVVDLRGSVVVDRRPLPDKTPFERAARRLLARHPARRRYRLGRG